MIGRKAQINIQDNYSNSKISDTIDRYLNRILKS